MLCYILIIILIIISIFYFLSHIKLEVGKERKV